jgi:hypothetical protein
MQATRELMWEDNRGVCVCGCAVRYGSAHSAKYGRWEYEESGLADTRCVDKEKEKETKYRE